MENIINPVHTNPRMFTYPPAPWPGSKTNIWVDVYWVLTEGNYKLQVSEDGLTWSEFGKPINVGQGETYWHTDSVDQFPNPPKNLRWQRVVQIT